MAHLLDDSKGFTAFVSANGVPAWHGLGQIMPGVVCVKEALQHGGLDFHVQKMPNIHFIPDLSGGNDHLEIISEESFFTYRTDVNKVLGSNVGKDYTVVQNRECFEVVDEILQSGRASIETAGAISDGRVTFVCLKYDDNIRVASSDIVNQYVLFSNSHDGSMSLRATPTNIRVVCNNTLTAALRGANKGIKIRHTASAQDRLSEASKVLKLLAHNTDINAENYNKMRETVISRAQMWDYFGNIFFDESEIKKLQSGEPAKEFISARKRNVVDAVLDFADTGIGQSMAMRGNDHTLWSAYNAVTGYLTRKSFKTYEKRTDNLLFGGGADTVEMAGILAAEPEKIKPLSKGRGMGFGSFSLN